MEVVLILNHVHTFTDDLFQRSFDTLIWKDAHKLGFDFSYFRLLNSNFFLMYFEMAYNIAKQKRRYKILCRKMYKVFDCFSFSKIAHKYLCFVSGIPCLPLPSDQT